MVVTAANRTYWLVAAVNTAVIDMVLDASMCVPSGDGFGDMSALIAEVAHPGNNGDVREQWRNRAASFYKGTADVCSPDSELALVLKVSQVLSRCCIDKTSPLVLVLGQSKPLSPTVMIEIHRIISECGRESSQP